VKKRVIRITNYRRENAFREKEEAAEDRDPQAEKAVEKKSA
jgi:hypothetical protein